MKEERHNKKEREEIDVLKTKMEEYLTEAAEKWSHPTALVERGNQLLEQANKAKDSEESLALWKNSLDCYTKACSLGSPEGCFNQGNLIWNGWNSSKGEVAPVVPDQKRAMEAFHQAITLGDADSMYFVGVQFLSVDEEDHPSPNLLEQLSDGLQWIEKAASLGHGGALYYLALLHHNGHEALNIPACTPMQFAERLDMAVDAGEADALFLRGHSFYRGDSGYPLDYAKALNDFLAAADLGHADAAVSAGAVLHQSHPGVQQDQQKAFQLYQLGGELGSEDGWRNVVACYLTGEGVPQSVETAKYIAKTMLQDSDQQQ